MAIAKPQLDGGWGMIRIATEAVAASWKALATWLFPPIILWSTYAICTDGLQMVALIGTTIAAVAGGFKLTIEAWKSWESLKSKKAKHK